MENHDTVLRFPDVARGPRNSVMICDDKKPTRRGFRSMMQAILAGWVVLTALAAAVVVALFVG